MTQISIPIPTSPIGYVDINGQKLPVIAPREWYRYFGLLFTAVGGSTGGVDEMALIDVGGHSASIDGGLGALFHRVAALEAQSLPPRQDAVALDITALRPNDEMAEIIKLFSTIKTGVYTPTLTNVANIDASTSYQATWVRVNDTVTVSGRLAIDPTLTATTTTLGISLPIPSNLTAVNTDCAGVAADEDIAGMCGAISADATNDRANLQFKSNDITNTGLSYVFVYRIL